MALDAPPAEIARGRVGPNAVIRLAEALAAGPGEDAARAVFDAAGLPAMRTAPPERMVDETVAARLFRAVHAVLPRETADAVLYEAGRRTGAYVLAHRLPSPVRAVLRALPPVLARPVLMAAIRRNAWTFAGSGRVTTGARVIEIVDNPLAVPGCRWHVGTFETLFRALVAADTTVRHVARGVDGAPVCRFVVERGAPRG